MERVDGWLVARVQIKLPPDFCPLSSKLNEKRNKTQYYNDLDSWLKNETCLDPADVPLVRKVII